MKIAIGWDHAGIEEAKLIIGALKRTGHEITLSIGSEGEPVDYPDIARIIAVEVVSGDAEYGVLICGTGIGMAMTANKRSGIRAFVGSSQEGVRMARQHNHANVICFGARIQYPAEMYGLLTTFLETDEDPGERHLRRIGKMEE